MFGCKELVGSDAEMFSALPLNDVFSVVWTFSVIFSDVDEESLFIDDICRFSINIVEFVIIGSPWNRKGIVTPKISIDLVVASSTAIVVIVVEPLLSPRFESSSLNVFWYFCSVLTLKSIGFFFGSIVVFDSDLRSFVWFLVSLRSGSTPSISSPTAPGNSKYIFH